MLATTPPDDVETSEQPTDNAYQLMADLGSVMEAGVAVTCDDASITQDMRCTWWGGTCGRDCGVSRRACPVRC